MNFVADYSRQLSLDWMSPSKQTAIIQSRILVFGAGGLGVAAISYLSGAGVGAITIVDFDRIEASNLHRQTIYQVSDIGHYKAIITASYITERNPNCDINAITEFLDLPELYQLCEKHDFYSIVYESSLGKCNEMDSQPCKNTIFYNILYESSFGRCNALDSQP